LTRFLADENVPGLVVEQLRNAGHDMAFIAEDSPSLRDEVVLSIAVREERVLITSDKQDYGNLAFSEGAQADCGVILFRLQDMSPPTQVAFMVGILNNEVDWRGHFSVVRIRPTPPTDP
jgi:predicted nuclease of predicted toxin-antitoxin system